MKLTKWLPILIAAAIAWTILVLMCAKVFGHDTVKIRDGKEVHDAERERESNDRRGNDSHWHFGETQFGAWDRCIADTYDEENHEYRPEMCDEGPPPPPPPPKPEPPPPPEPKPEPPPPPPPKTTTTRTVTPRGDTRTESTETRSPTSEPEPSPEPPQNEGQSTPSRYKTSNSMIQLRIQRRKLKRMLHSLPLINRLRHLRNR